jgi:hypothetical protein
MTEVSIENLKIMTIEEAIEHTGFEEIGDLIKTSGVYRILSGTRNSFEECELVGDLDMKVLKLMTKEQCVESLVGEDCEDEEELEGTIEHVEEFYTINNDDGLGVMFCFTEEDYDIFVKVTV